MENQTDRLHIKFDGVNLASGTIDAYDLATTVMASADTLRGIANSIPSTKNSELKIDVTALRPGSFEVDFSISLKNIVDHGIAVLPLINSQTINSVKDVIKTFKSLIEVKKFLKGEKPTKVELNQTGDNTNAVVYNFTGDHMVVNMPTYNVMQDKQTNEKLKKVFSPLLKEGNEIETIQISTPDDISEEKIEITKDQAKYFEQTEELQTIPTYKIRGVVTAMDRKTNNGKLTVGDEKRCHFEVEIEDIKNLEKVANGLIDSMRGKTPIVVLGEAVLDLESNIKKIKIKDIELDEKLFPDM